MQLRKAKAADEIVSWIAEGTEITGETSFAGGLRVEGTVKGKMRSEGTLVIGPSGKVQAELEVRKTVVEGEFRGVIRAAERVEIRKAGKVYGDIYAPCLIIEGGAFFEGRCNMADKTPAEAGENLGAKA